MDGGGALVCGTQTGVWQAPKQPTCLAAGRASGPKQVHRPGSGVALQARSTNPLKILNLTDTAPLASPWANFSLIHGAQMTELRMKTTTRISPSLALEFQRDEGNSLSDLFSRFFFAEPRFRASSPDLEHMRDLREHFTLKSPGAKLTTAAAYYWIEAYITRADRDAACGLAGGPDVKYFPIRPKEIPNREINRIACGYPINHPRFESVFEPTFAIAVHKLAHEIACHGADRSYTPAAVEFAIARVYYSIAALPEGSKFRFKIDGLSLFEKRRQCTLDQTAKLLESRLILQTTRLVVLH